MSSPYEGTPDPWWPFHGVMTWDQATEWVASLVERAVAAERERDELKAQLAEAQKLVAFLSGGEDADAQR